MKFHVAILSLWLLAALLGLTLQMPAVDLAAALAPPTPEAWLGRDSLGKSVATMLLAGAKTALVVGFGSVLLAGIFGVVVGSAAGLLGGIVDALTMRAIDVLLAFPGLLLAIALTAILGPSTFNIVLALSLLGWTGFARLARGQALQLKQQLYVDAVRTAGGSRRRLLFLHVLPNMLGPIGVQTAFAIAAAILAESSLSFLGLGDPTSPSWGAVLADGVRFLRVAPHLAVFPGLALTAVTLALHATGDRLATAVDPRQAKI